MVDSLFSRPEGTRCILYAPLVDGRKGEQRDLLNRLTRDGFVRVRIDGEIMDLDQEINLARNNRHRIEAVVDRVIIKKGARQRIAQSVATAVQLAEGFLLAGFPDLDEEQLFSERAACSICGISLIDLSPQLFSFNNPQGACEECAGLGTRHFFDQNLIIPDKSLSLNQGAIAPWRNRSPWSYSSQLLAALADHYQFSLDLPFKKLSARAKKVILKGTGTESINFQYRRRRRSQTSRKPFEGIIPHLDRRYHETKSGTIREELSAYMNEQSCSRCHGARLKKEALAVRVGSWAIHELTAVPIARLLPEVKKINFTSRQEIIAGRIIREVSDRLTFLLDVGLGYLSLDRTAMTLSGGEAQRIRLASQIGSRLSGVLYILDEPSIGLHPRDNDRLIKTLISLRDIGNTVMVVEHDAETILAADHVLDIGPGGRYPWGSDNIQRSGGRTGGG